ncbi:hypothetical protein EMCRGX_G033345 [Ephydatia muelleri]
MHKRMAFLDLGPLMFGTTTRLINDGPVMLGGNGVVVQIDESLFKHKPKYHRGRRADYKQWVFGMVDTSQTPSLGFMQMVDTRDAATLLPIIRAHTALQEPSSTLMNGLHTEGYHRISHINNMPLCGGSHELPTIEDFETVPSPPSSHVTPEAAKSTSHSSQPATTKQVSTPSRSQMELPLRAGTNRRTALSGSEGLELNGADCGDERSDFELQRARSIRLNKEFLHSQQMVCSGYKISSFTFNSNRSQMSWMKLMLFWLPKSGGVGVMLQNQALIQWYQQLMMLASKAKEELYVERNDGTCWKPASGRKKGYP